MNDQNQHPDKTHLFNKLIELERISKEGPTLHVVSDAMRALLACIGMLIGSVVLYKHEPGFWLTKSIAVLVGLWTTFYTYLAALQSCFIAGFAVMDVLEHILHPNIFKRHRYWIDLTIAGLSMLMTLGLVLFVAFNVSRALDH